MTPQAVELAPARRFRAARQLISHLAARRALPAPDWLAPAEAALFARMAPADQREGLAVAAELEAWGHGADRNLLVAGVLHDAGKSLAASDAPGYRVLFTLLETFAPALLPRAAARSDTMRVLTNHAILGAGLAAEAGLPDDVRLLIAGHHSSAPDTRAEALQRADALH